LYEPDRAKERREAAGARGEARKRRLPPTWRAPPNTGASPARSSFQQAGQLRRRSLPDKQAATYQKNNNPAEGDNSREGCEIPIEARPDLRLNISTKGSF
jgi:hypothetical protein